MSIRSHGMTAPGGHMNRRDFIRAGSLGMTRLGLAGWHGPEAKGAIRSASGRAKAVIRLWMSGGPAQTDTFDPKPEAGVDFSGPFRHPIETNVKGIRIGEWLPLMAAQADKYAILRSVTHTYNSHDAGVREMLTGVMTASKQNEAGRFDGQSSCVTQVPSPDECFKAGFPGGPNNDNVCGYSVFPDDRREAFDLSREKDSLRDRYGRHHFGQSCLRARRLVERGVSHVTVEMGGWDTHVEHFAVMRKQLPILDSGFATLLQDLADRGLLESTIVVWCGEFGRTPRLAREAPWHGGRHHFGNCFCVVVAGGGFKGGRVVGASDRTGESVLDRPVHPQDLMASIHALWGIDPNGRLASQGGGGQAAPIVSCRQDGGWLAEIMPGDALPAAAGTGQYRHQILSRSRGACDA